MDNQTKETEFREKVAEMRKYQKLHKETLIYGWRSKAIRLEKEVDAMLTEFGL